MVQEPFEIIELDVENEESQGKTEDLSPLKAQLNNLRYQVTLYGEGIIPIPTHRKVIEELQEKMGRRVDVSKVSLGRITGRIKGIEKN